MFVSALGSLAYCETISKSATEGGEESEAEWRTLQCESRLPGIIPNSWRIDDVRHKSRPAGVGG